MQYAVRALTANYEIVTIGAVGSAIRQNMHKPSPRVLIFSRPPLFAQALRQLVEDSGSTVVGVESLTESAIGRIQILRPDIIVVDDSAISPRLLTNLLDCTPAVRVVCLALENNLVRVYDSYQLDVHQAQDLAVILNIPKQTRHLQTSTELKGG